MSPFEFIRAVRSIPRKEMRSTDRLVLMVYGSHCGGKGEPYICYPSIDLLAEECGLTTRAVRQVNARLVAGGWITLAGRGPKGVNRIHLNVIQGERYSGWALNHVHPPLNSIQVTPEPRSPKEYKKSPVEESKEESKEESNPPKSPQGDEQLSDEVVKVYEVWHQWHPKAAKKPSKEFRKRVTARLGDGYAVEDLCAVAKWAHTSDSFVPTKLRQGQHLGPETLYKPTKMLDRIEAATAPEPRKRGEHTPDYDWREDEAEEVDEDVLDGLKLFAGGEG